MTDEITDIIKKLEMYQTQIKEQAKIEVLNFVENRGDYYFEYIRKEAEDNIITHINYRLKTIQSIQDMITFLNINYNPEFMYKIRRDLNQMPVTYSDIDVTKIE